MLLDLTNALSEQNWKFILQGLTVLPISLHSWGHVWSLPLPNGSGEVRVWFPTATLIIRALFDGSGLPLIPQEPWKILCWMLLLRLQSSRTRMSWMQNRREEGVNWPHWVGPRIDFLIEIMLSSWLCTIINTIKYRGAKQDFEGHSGKLALVVKNLPTNAEDRRNAGLIPGSGRSSGGGHGNPLQYSCLENPWTEEPGGLQFMGLQRVRHNSSDLAHPHA